MAIQSTFKRDDVEVDSKIALTITCATCGEFRTFIIDANLTMILNGDWSAISIHVQCTKCRHMIEVSLGWHSSESGYSSIPVSLEGHKTEVIDDMGLGNKKEATKE